MQTTFNSQAAAARSLSADGFAYKGSIYGGSWQKPSTNVVDGRPQTCFVLIERRRVDPAHGSDYFELRFF